MDPYCLRLGEHMVAGADLAAHLGVPVGHIPLKSLGGDAAWLFDREDPDPLVKDLFGVVPDMDLVGPSLEEKRQTFAGE